MRAGQAFTHLVEFPDGVPDGDVSWELLDGRGLSVASGTMTPAPDAASLIITIPGADNELDTGVLSGSRELSWSYLLSGLSQTGHQPYRLEAFLPLGVSVDGVRRKLGVETHELDEDTVDLAIAYGQFQNMVTSAVLDAVDGYEASLARDAVEALAALPLLPVLSVSLALKESSGTDQFQRDKINWDGLREQLNRYVASAVALIAPALDETVNFGPLVVPVVRSPDPVTNA